MITINHFQIRRRLLFHVTMINCEIVISISLIWLPKQELPKITMFLYLEAMRKSDLSFPSVSMMKKEQ